MPLTRPPLRLYLAAVLWLAMLGHAAAGWLVYELKFAPGDASVNFSFYSSAYLVAPLNGGPVSILLTTEEEGRYYARAESSGKFFVAANDQTRKAVFSALALKGTSQAFYTASGRLNRPLLLNHADGSTRTWHVAETLSGRLMCADDESERGPAADGSLGVIGDAVLTATLREDLTAIASARYHSQAGATAYLVELLEKYGYEPDEGTVAAPVAPRAAGGVIDPSLFPAAN
jgi:hypothetical protein